MESKNRPTVLQRLALLWDNNADIIKPTSYGIASVGFLIALRRTRPFLKLRKPSDIPVHFLHKRVPLQGTVKQIDTNYGTVLMVDHKPLVPLPRFTSPKYLPVKISKVNVMSNGISWLETVLSGKQITFKPLAMQKEYLECIVTIQGKEKEPLNIGKELVKVGFGIPQKIPKESVKDKEILKYYKDIINAEKWAQRRRNGHWHFVKQPTLLWKIQMTINEKAQHILPIQITKLLNI